jgi:hypothetical protein
MKFRLTELKDDNESFNLLTSCAKISYSHNLNSKNLQHYMVKPAYWKLPTAEWFYRPGSLGSRGKKITHLYGKEILFNGKYFGPMRFRYR